MATALEPLLARLSELQAQAKGLHQDTRDVDVRSDIRELSRQVASLGEQLSRDSSEGVRQRAADAVHGFTSRIQRLEQQARRPQRQR